MGRNTSASNNINKSELFIVSVLALVTGGLVFSIRASILLDLQNTFFGVSNVHAAEIIGAAVGAAFLGLAIANFIGGPLCDFVGMGRLLGIASLLHVVGTAVIIWAKPISGAIPVYWTLWLGMMSVGLAHGLVEAVINPLTTTLYPEDKTHKLNVLHAWWPGGIIIGGLIAFGLGKLGVGWQIKQAVIFLPAIAYGILALTAKFPPTERLAAGVSNKDMLKEVFRPAFILWWLCMWLTASSELGPGQWVDAVLTRNVGLQGILLLVYVSGLMFVMRHFAGSFAHKWSPVGLMWFSSILAGAGLLALSWANSPLTGILGATVWGIGVCYMWPTMLAVTSEKFPKSGALGLGLIGTAGNLSIYFALPKIGMIFDIYKQKAAEAAGTTFEALSRLPADNPQLVSVLKSASSYSFRYVAILPAVLVVFFGAIWLSDKAKGGYKAVRLTGPEPEQAPKKAKV